MRSNDRQEGEGPSAPLVSIRIPSYNHAPYIAQALTSVLDDPYPNKQIVIVDDASTDHSDRVIRAWITANGERIAVKYCRRDVNQGIARTINQTIALCNGEYIASLASDDFLLPGGLQQRCRYLRDNPHKMAVFSDCIVVDGHGRQIADSGLTGPHRADTRCFETDRGIRREFISNWFVPGPVLMVRRELFELIGGYDEDTVVEDWDLYLRMAAKNLIGYVDDKVSAYRIHESNFSRRPEGNLSRLASTQRMLRKNLRLFGFADKIRILGLLADVTFYLNYLKAREALSAKAKI